MINSPAPDVIRANVENTVFIFLKQRLFVNGFIGSCKEMCLFKFAQEVIAKSLLGKQLLKKVVLQCFNESTSTHKTQANLQNNYNYPNTFYFCRKPFLRKKNPEVIQTAPKTYFTAHFL